MGFYLNSTIAYTLYKDETVMANMIASFFSEVCDAADIFDSLGVLSIPAVLSSIYFWNIRWLPKKELVMLLDLLRQKLTCYMRDISQHVYHRKLREMDYRYGMTVIILVSVREFITHVL